MKQVLKYVTMTKACSYMVILYLL